MNPVTSLRRAVQTSLRALNAPESSPPSGDSREVEPRWRRLLRSPRAPYVAAAVAVLVIAGVWLLTRPPLVTVAEAWRGEAVDVVYATGVVEYVRQASIAPVVTAPIQRVYVAEDERVRRGALLAQLEDGPQRGTVAQLQAQAATARLAANRVQRLYSRGFASRAALDEALGVRNAAEAAAASARARLADYAIRAPFAGTILRREAEPGNLATPSTILFVMADESALRVTADIDERDIALVEEGQPALIRADAFDDRTFDATVIEVTPHGDAMTRVFRVRLGLGDDTMLRTGMTVEANIIAGRRENAVLVPATAAQDDVAWVVEDGRVERRAIVRGAAGDEAVEIVEGVTAGETVVVDPPDSLRDGRRIRVRGS